MSDGSLPSARLRLSPRCGPRLRNVSSTTDRGIAGETSIHFSGWHFFHCLDTNDCIDSSKHAIIKFESGCIELFNQTFDKDSALVEYNTLLFKMARQYLVIIDRGMESLHFNTSAHRVDCVSSNANYRSSLRLHICEFLAYVCNYFDRLALDDDCINPSATSIGLLDRLVPSVSENMLSLQLLLNNLGQLKNKSAIVGCTSSYHKLHAFLDIYCYHLDFLLCIEGRKTNVHFEGTNVMPQVEKQVNLFISHLLLLAIEKFHNLSFLDLVSDSPFSCVCIKQVWVMLIRLLDTLHERNNNKKPFWMFVNSLLQKVSHGSSSDKYSFSNELCPVPEEFVCRTPEMFKLWLVSHLAILYEHEHLPIKENFFQIESVIKQCVAPDSPISEIQLKTIILLITPLVSGIWVPKSEVIMILWEYFHRRLNSMFLEQNAPVGVNSLQVVKKTSAAMLNEVKRYLEENFQHGDSWSLFLHLLALYLKRCTQKHWHQVRGRIYSKFSPTKLQALTELGLYRLSSLFLTLCLSVDMKEASMKLLELLALLNPTDSLRCHVLWRSHLALILLYMEHDTDIATISLPLRSKLNSISEMKNDVSLSMMRALVEELQSLIECDSFLKLSGSTLIDAWVPHYLASCSETDACQLYSVFLTLILKVQGIWKENFPVQASVLADSLWRHILPCILMSTNNTKSCESESVLGYHLTLLALQLPAPSRSFISIFCRFVNSPSINVNVVQKYICLLNTDPVAMKALEKMENYQGLIVRSWLRCLILSVDGTSHNISSLTRLVSELPEIVELASRQQINMPEESDTLAAFLKIVASASSYNERISFYFSQVEACLTRTTISSEALAIRLYKCAATFLQHAPNIIYNKVASHSKTMNLLNAIMSHLVLPASVYSSDLQLNTYVKNAISETIHLFIQGLAHLNPRSDAYIFKCLKDLIIQYLPRLVKSQPNTMHNFLALEPEAHPLLKCFDNLQSIKSNETGTLVLEVLSTTCIACKGKTRHNYTTLALAIVKEVLRKWIGQPEIIQLVTECALGHVLEVVMFTEGTTSMAHCKGMEILKMLLNQTGDIKNNQANVVVNITKEHLAFSAVYVFRLLECVASIDPQLVKTSLPRVKDLVAKVEEKRGVSFDRGLRSGIEKIDLLLLDQCS